VILACENSGRRGGDQRRGQPRFQLPQR